MANLSKLVNTTKAKVLLVAVVLSMGYAVWECGRQYYWRSHPEIAFGSIVGLKLPPGVHASGYARVMNDNLIHHTHYWLLEGPPSALRQVLAGTDFEQSPDAYYMLPDLDKLFGVPRPWKSVVAGYEWEHARNRWFLLFAGEDSALYID